MHMSLELKFIDGKFTHVQLVKASGYQGAYKPVYSI